MFPIIVNCDLASGGQKVIQFRGREIRLNIPLPTHSQSLYFPLKCKDSCREPAQMTQEPQRTCVALEQQQGARQTNPSHLSYVWPTELEGWLIKAVSKLCYPCVKTEVCFNLLTEYRINIIDTLWCLAFCQHTVL